MKFPSSATTKRFKVSIRPVYDGRPIRPEAEPVNGKAFDFRFGWDMDDDDPYPGEVAWIPWDDSYPQDAPAWLASGDLIEENAK